MNINKNLYSMSVPAKTFLFGEYLVLHGGPGMVLTSLPRFHLIVDKQVPFKISGIKAQSPAGKLIQRYENLFHPYHLNFIDDTDGMGGFGASSAQFLMIYALRCMLSNESIHEEKLLNEYQSLAFTGEGLPPSGVDLIAQLHGGLCYFHKAKMEVKIFSWPFDDIDYCLIHTGNKLATHEHLKTLASLDLSHLEKIVMQGKCSLEEKNSQQFIAAISNYADALAEKNLLASSTQAILKQLSTRKDILATKGCGALGADVIVLFFKRGNHQVMAWLKEQKFNIIAYGHSIEPGLKINEN